MSARHSKKKNVTEKKDAAPAPPRPGRVARFFSALGHAARDRDYHLALAGGVAGVLAWPPVGLWWLGPLAPALLFLAAQRAATPGAALRRMLAGGWLFYFGAIHWLCTLWRFNPVAPLGIMLLAVYFALWPALGTWALRRWAWSSSPALQFTAWGSMWLLTEWVRTLGRLAAVLGELGHMWAAHPALIQPAAWLGELGVSLAVLWAAGFLLWAGRWVLTRRVEKTAAGLAGMAALALVPVLYMFAWADQQAVEMKIDQAPETQDGWQVALVQPNVDQITKFNSYANPDAKVRWSLQEKIFATQEEMIAQAKREGWGLALLPETSFTQIDFETNPLLRARAARLARTAGADLLVGVTRWVNPDTPQEEFYNSAYLISQSGDYSPPYDKIRLVPFGEDLPYFEYIPGLQSIVGIGQFNRGHSATLFETGPYRFGTMICFESTFSQMARMFANKGASFLAVITNDAWYGMSAGVKAHHDLSYLRAVETRRWVVRCANTGISSVIDPAGRDLASLPLGTQGIVEQKIYPSVSPASTFFMRLG